MAPRRAFFSRYGVSQVVLHIGLGVAALVFTYPFWWMVAGSLKTPAAFYHDTLNLWPETLMWSNYASAWSIAGFATYLKNTVVVAVTTTLLVLLLTSLAGYALARGYFFGRQLVIGCILLTMFLPRGYTILPIFTLIQALGLLNTLWAVILVSLGTSLLFNTFLFVSYFSALPSDLEEAATLDGASFPDIYIHVALPYAQPMLIAVGLLEFVEHWNSFFIPLIFTLGRPELRTLSVGMYAFVGQHNTDWTLMCAAATMSLLPIMVLFAFLQRRFVEGIAGAIHG